MPERNSQSIRPEAREACLKHRLFIPFKRADKAPGSILSGWQKKRCWQPADLHLARQPGFRIKSQLHASDAMFFEKRHRLCRAAPINRDKQHRDPVTGKRGRGA